MSRRLNDDWLEEHITDRLLKNQLQTAQAADAAKQAYQKEMNAMPVVAPTPKELVEEWKPVLGKLKDAQHPTTFNNIDTEQLKDFLTHSYINIASIHYWEGAYDEQGETSDWVEENLPKLTAVIAADRNKLIKHLSFYYGLPEAEMKKVAEDVK